MKTLLYITCILLCTQSFAVGAKDPLSSKRRNTRDQFADMYPQKNLSQRGVKLVTDEYGKLRVNLGKYRYQAKRKPWSSYFYRYSDLDLWQAPDSPYQKMDNFLRAKGFNANAAEWHEKRIYNPDAAKWEGFCNFWALASIFEDDIQGSKSIDGTCFSPADIKAYMITVYAEPFDKDWNGWYGQRNNDSALTIQQDIYPHEFHKFLQVQLNYRQMPFIIEHDMGSPIWNQPVYGAYVSIYRSKEYPNDAVEVSLTLELAKYNLSARERKMDKESGVGTILQTRDYYYRLFGHWDGDEFVVNTSRWQDRSKKSHPDFVIEMPRSPALLRYIQNLRAKKQFKTHIRNPKRFGFQADYDWAKNWVRGRLVTANPNISPEFLMDQFLPRAKQAPACQVADSKQQRNLVFHRSQPNNTRKQDNSYSNREESCPIGEEWDTSLDECISSYD